MTLEELQQIVVGGESDRLEFKRTTGDLKGGLETLCGFLNASGGHVLFGVGASGRISGQSVSDSTLRDVAAELARLDPPAAIVQSRMRVNDANEVLALEAVPQAGIPFTYNGRAFRRVGTTTSLMPQAVYERLLLERGHSQQRWENQQADGYSLRNLDRREIVRTANEATSAGRLETPVKSASEVLRKLHLVDGSVTQAAVVAFAREVLPGYPQCGLRMARFRGTKKDEFLDQRQITGHAFALLEEAMIFLRRHLPVAGRFEPGVMTRLDEPLFPTLALREAVVNALSHRDYSIVGGAISIAVFDDRLEIASTGTLPFGQKVQDLKREHVSKPRNPLLADVFYRRGLIERWGRGTQKIVSLCVEAGHPEPEFEERAGEVIVRFIPSAYIPPHRISHDLTERQRRILHALRAGSQRSIGDLRSEIDPELPKSTLRDDLNMLRSLHLITSGGSGRGSYWQLAQAAGQPFGGSKKRSKSPE